MGREQRLIVHEFMVKSIDEGERLDLWLARREIGLTRSRVQQLIGTGLVTVDGQRTKNNHRLRLSQQVIVRVPQEQPPVIGPENIPLTFIYEDDHIAVVNKPQGMVTHPAQGHYSGTLVNALLYHVDHLSDINGSLRPGIVHRLDKDTSGILVIAKDNESHLKLAKQLKMRSVKREYLALAHGNFSAEQGTIDAPLARHPIARKKMAVVPGGRQAVTHYWVLECFGSYTLLRLQLETGRTHQIRVHLAHIGHPVVGDMVYGSRRRSQFGLRGQLLHAWRLGFEHPITQEICQFTAELPDYFRQTLCRMQ